MLKLTQVSKYYRSKETVTQALRRVSLSMHAGEFVVITGESGSGKSTLLNVISGLDSYEEGELYINGKETSYFSQEDWESYRSQYIGFIFQNYNIIDAYTVYQNVLAALTIQGYDKAKRKDRALELIERVGLKDQTHQKSSTLSGGQKQRVSIARALAKDAPIIVADEPTGNLDKKTGETIIELLKEVSKDKLVIMVTHSFEAVKAYATRRVRLFDGEIAEDQTIKSVKQSIVEPATKHFGMQFLEQIQMAIRNLLSAPKRLIFTLTIGLFIVAVFTLAYGSYVDASHEDSYMGTSPYFRNTNPSRLVVVKQDGTAFTPEELSTLSGLNHVEGLIEFDPLLDMALIHDNSVFNIFTSTHLSNRQLKAGNVPAATHDILVPETSDYTVGETVSFRFTTHEGRWAVHDPSMGSVQTVNLNLTITGTHNFDEQTIYVHEDFFNIPLYRYRALVSGYEPHVSVHATHETSILELPLVRIMIDNTLDQNTLILNQSLYDYLENNLEDIGYQGAPEDALLDYALHHAFTDNPPSETLTIVDTITGDEFDRYTMRLYINESTLLTLFETHPKQITLVVEDTFAARQVENAIDETTYRTIHPASYQPTYFFDPGIFLRLMATIGITLLLFGMYFTTYLSLRNIMESRKKDYVIFRSIGATKKDLNRITIIELMLVFGVSLMIIYALLMLNMMLQTPIPNYLRYYTLGNYLFAFALLMFMALLLGIRFNQRIFKDSVITALRVE